MGRVGQDQGASRDLECFICWKSILWNSERGFKILLFEKTSKFEKYRWIHCLSKVSIKIRQFPRHLSACSKMIIHYTKFKTIIIGFNCMSKIYLKKNNHWIHGWIKYLVSYNHNHFYLTIMFSRSDSGYKSRIDHFMV